MKRRAAAILGMAAIVTAASGRSGAFPLGFSAGGGIGIGYYAMNSFNQHIGIVAQENYRTIAELGSGVNSRVEGRLWYERIAALAAGYEHFWGETEPIEADFSIEYRMPANVYTFGVIVTPVQFENSIDLCVGLNHCWIDALYGTNETTTRIVEWEGEDTGFELYAEAHSNFINPIEIGLQLGYRRLKVDRFENARGEIAYFEEGVPVVMDYSGAFFYLTASIRIN